MGRRKRARRPSTRKLQSQNDDDRISELPDEILVSILSFLPTEEAVMVSSVVSRRWKNLWTNLPRLEFCWREWSPRPFRPLFEESDVNMYVNLVNQVTKLHVAKTTMASTIEELAIGLPLGSKYSHDIDKWVEFAARKQVKKLKLDFGIRQDVCVGTPIYFPYFDGSRFCDGKVCYDGGNPSYEGFLQASPSPSVANTNNDIVRLYWLRDLNLRGVDVGDKAMDCLFSNSPFLERLCVIDSQKLVRLEVHNAPNLKYLELRLCNKLQHLDVSAPNLDTFKLFNRGWLAHLNIDAPILSRASFNVYPDISDFFGHDRPVILQAHGTPEALWFDYTGKPPMFHYLLKLLGPVSHVSNRLALGLSTDAFCVVCLAFDFSTRLPDLSRVEHLKIKINPWPTWYICGNEKHRREDDRWMNYLWPCALVKAAPFLQKLSIKLSDRQHGVIHDIHFGSKWVHEGVAENVEIFLTRLGGHYSHRHLKEVELLGFTGSRNEVEIVLYLVEIAATSLEKISIQVCLPSPHWPAEDLLRYRANQYEQVFRHCAELLRTHIPTHIDVVII